MGMLDGLLGGAGGGAGGAMGGAMGAAASATPMGMASAGLNAVGDVAKAMSDSGDVSSSNKLKADLGGNKTNYTDSFGGINFASKESKTNKMLLIGGAIFFILLVAKNKKLI